MPDTQNPIIAAFETAKASGATATNLRDDLSGYQIGYPGCYLIQDAVDNATAEEITEAQTIVATLVQQEQAKSGFSTVEEAAALFVSAPENIHFAPAPSGVGKTSTMDAVIASLGAVQIVGGSDRDRLIARFAGHNGPIFDFDENGDLFQAEWFSTGRGSAPRAAIVTNLSQASEQARANLKVRLANFELVGVVLR